MNQHIRLPRLSPDQQMTIKEFLAFTASRPHEERWELIEGVPVLSPSPADFHQMIVGNITAFLLQEKGRIGASWLPMPGIGTQVPVSPNSLPQPDVFVKAGALTGQHFTDDALVIFEVLSKSNTKADREWRRRVYASVPNCQHYVTVSLKAADATILDRASEWKARRVQGLDGEFELLGLGLRIPLAVIYRFTPLAEISPALRRRR